LKSSTELMYSIAADPFKNVLMNEIPRRDSIRAITLRLITKNTRSVNLFDNIEIKAPVCLS
jgi:hypothetical protein